MLQEVSHLCVPLSTSSFFIKPDTTFSLRLVKLKAELTGILLGCCSWISLTSSTRCSVGPENRKMHQNELLRKDTELIRRRKSKQFYLNKVYLNHNGFAYNMRNIVVQQIWELLCVPCLQTKKGQSCCCFFNLHLNKKVTTIKSTEKHAYCN
ncbi:hypothetical protein GOODEAATRI_033468 [Goodea atripinnis]|uniref:Uncharacterized protein n=1 Tax=Goodea atripinnis TaxID=208336 RepID=A0ABV0P9S7_9TELE